ncbi:MAG TPA: L-aspartate oxidase [Hyphomicrobiaceae bacterium]|nr:L-aspartate oxidase [Hyphomicrobiaceae bacterium]
MTSNSDVNNLPRPARIIIIGAGLAGLFTALKLAPLPVTVVAAAPLGEGASSAWAQGGIAAAVGEGDTPSAHAADTIAAGAGIVSGTIARMVAEEASERVHDLLSYGVPFDRDLEGRLVLSREAAHSAKRIVRVAGDGAGRAIMQALIATVRATPSIQVLEGYLATKLTLNNAQAVDGVVLTRASEPAANYTIAGADAVILATGGTGALYALTTNPPYSRGNGIAMAAKAGAVVTDAEFVQFHPTAIDVDIDPAPLATEALRGEGAVLINDAGNRFMSDIHPDAELGPRDIVAQGVFRELQAGRGAYLDCRDAIGSEFPTRFPTVYERCIAAGIDPVTQPIPVAPAEHYHMGGLKTDANARTNVAGLWAIGEVAATGLHGANRLASNSLLEAVVFAARAAADITSTASAPADAAPRPTMKRTPATHLPDEQMRDSALRLIRATMTNNVGVERTAEGLIAALETLKLIDAGADGDPEIENAVLAARFITEAALRRKESRGGHYRSDYPGTDPAQASSRGMTLAGLTLRDGAFARSLLTGLTEQPETSITPKA